MPAPTRLTRSGALVDRPMGRPFEQIENLVGYHRHMIGALIAERTLRNAMTMAVAAEATPLAADAAGVFHVGNSRMTLDTVIGAFCDGATAEEIADQYPAISLGQVYAVIAYYLAHTAEVDDYLRAHERRAAEVRAANERIFAPAGKHARLIARQAGPESA